MLRLFPLSWRLGWLALPLLFAVLALAAPAADLRLPGDAAVLSAAGDQVSPFLAPGDGVTLAVWSDERSVPDDGFYYYYETSADIYAMRLDSAGVPLDSVPFVVTAAPGGQSSPQAVWNGTHWLVVFETVGLGGTGYYYQTMLAAVRVSADGAVIDDKPFPIYSEAPSGWRIASDGVGWVLAFQANNSRLALLSIAADGTANLPPVTVASSTYYMRNNLRLAYSDGVYLLTWNEASYGGRARRFDANLNFLDLEPYPILLDSLQGLAAGNGQFYAIWTRQQPDFTQAVMGSRISLDGAVVDGGGDGVIISGANQPQAFTTTALAWDGTTWRVTWGYDNAVRVARVASDGQVLDPGGVAVVGPETGRTAGAPGGGVQVIWTPRTDDQYDVMTARISADNVPGPNTTLSVGAPAQIRPDLALGDTSGLFVFRSDAGGTRRVLAQAVNLDGTPLMAEPIVLDSGAGINGPGRPNVAWNGNTFLVAWGTLAGIVAQRLDATGTPVDPAPFFVMDGFGPADVAAVNGTFLVTGRQFGYTVQIINAYAARVSADGSVLDPAPRLLGGIYVRTAPAVTAFSDRWLVAFHSNWTHDESNADTYAAFVDQNGATPGAFRVHGPFSTAGGNSFFELDVASNGSVAVMVQSQELSSGVETDLLARFIYADGTVSAYQNLTPWAGNQYRPKVTWDGTQFVIAYNEQRNRFAPWTLDPIDARSDLYGMRLLADGTVVDPLGFAYSLSAAAEAHPAVASAGGVTWLAGAVMEHAPHAAYRIAYTQAGAGNNQWPTAYPTASASAGDVPLAVAFDGTGSADPDGAVVSWLWDFGDGATASGALASHTYTTPGQYVATLTVTDDQGAQTVNAVAVDARPVNQLPVAVATSNVTTGKAPLSVIFYGEESYDPDGPLGNFEWSFSDGGTYYGRTAYHTFSTAGVHTATLKVYDSRGEFGTTDVVIDVLPPNAPPTAVASAAPTAGEVPLAVQFSAAGSADSDGTIVSYQWAFGDGGTSAEPDPSHLYTTAGDYIATLTVTDDEGATGSATVTIQVTPPTSFEQVAQGETPIDGTVQGTYVLTHVDDGSPQRITEIESGGRPSRRYSYLEHTWQFNVLPGASVTVLANAWAPPSSDGDTFAFDVSVNGGPYARMFVVGPSADGAPYQAYVLPPGTAGDVTIRVIDTNRAPGSRPLDTVMIDYLAILTDTDAGDPPPAPTNLTAAAVSAAQIDLAWQHVDPDTDGFTVERSLNGSDGWTVVGSADAAARDFSDAGLAADTTYFYRVLAYNAGGSSAPSNVASATTFQGAFVHLAALIGSSEPFGSNGRWDATVTIWVHDAAHQPVAGVTVYGEGTGGLVGSCVTDAAGTCSMTKRRIRESIVSVTFTLTDMTHPDFTYDPVANDVGTVVDITAP